jgi:purine-binding chemotaxis protein CheW
MSPVRDSLGDRSEDPQQKGVLEFLALELGRAHYALPLACVRGVVPLPSVTEVPRAPDHVLGVISLRAQVVTLIDLRSRLRLAPAPDSVRTRVLLIVVGTEIIALLIDGAVRIQRLHPDEIEPAAVLGGDAPAYLAGIGRPGTHLHEGARGSEPRGHRDEILILLDPTRLLGPPNPV